MPRVNVVCDRPLASTRGAGAARRVRLLAEAAWRRRRTTTVFALLALLAAVVSFHALDSYRTLTRHEAYVAVPAREMLAGGDFVVPRFGGLPRLEKPPLAYWLAASVGHVAGGIDEWTVRLPSAVAAVALAALVGWWGFRRGGIVTACGAAACQLTSGYVLLFARKAEVDMLLCLLTTAAGFLIATQPESEPSRRSFLRWVGIWTLLSLSWLAKFHYGPVMVLAPFVAFQLVQRKPSRVLAALNPAGLVLFAAAVAIWPMLVLERLPGAWDVWAHETLDRAVGDGLRKDPWWFYLPHLVTLTFPWTFFALAVVPHSWRRAWRERDAEERYLWIWLIVQLAIVTLSANKHRNYLLATLPVFSLWAGTAVAWIVARVREDKPLLNGVFGGTWALLVALTGLVVRRIAVDHWPELALPITLWLVAAVAGVWLVLWLLVRRREFAALCAAGLAFAAALGAFHVVLLPHADARRDDVRFLAELRRDRPAGGPEFAYGLGQAPQIYYLGAAATRLESPAEVLELLSGDAPLELVTRSDRVAELAGVATATVLATASGHSAGEDGGPPLVLVRLAR